MLELFVVMVVLTIFALMILPPTHNRARAGRIQCVNNLKQVGLATRVWEGDHGDKFPFFVSKTNGGTMEFNSSMDEWRHFQVMSNELSTPKVLICPEESKRLRQWATNFTTLGNSNLSYFVNLSATETDPQMILSGDRNITNGTPIKNGILELTANSPIGWTTELHNKVGNLALSDGSVQQVSSTGLRTAVGNSFTNRLQMPILGP